MTSELERKVVCPADVREWAKVMTDQVGAARRRWIYRVGQRIEDLEAEVDSVRVELAAEKAHADKLYEGLFGLRRFAGEWATSLLRQHRERRQ